MISIKMTNYDKVLGAFDPSIADLALASALNKTALKSRTEVSVQIRKVWTVKAGEIKESSWFIRARQLAWSKPSAQIIYSGRKLGLYHFSPRVGKKGVTVKPLVRKARSPAMHESGRKGFYREYMGGKNIWARTGEPKREMKKGRYAGTGIKREPITVLKVRSIPQMITKRVMRSLDAQIADDFPRIFDNEFAFMQGRASKRQARAIASRLL